jgi:diacylglycerol O-acyltransferase
MTDREPKQGELEYDDWMSESDALMWHIERDPLLRSTVLSVWVLDRPPDLEQFRNALGRTQHLVPRLRQRVVEDPLGVSPPRWVEDPLFDPDYHIRHLRAPGEGKMRDLLDLAAPIMSQAFDKDRPVWELHVVDGMEGGKCGVLMKVHHAMTDGVGMVRMTEGLVERTPEAGREALERARLREANLHDDEDEPPWTGAISTAGALTGPSAFVVGASADEAEEQGAPDKSNESREPNLFRLSDAVLHRTSTALDRGRRAALAVGRGLMGFAGHPVSTTGDVLGTVESVGRLVRPVSEPMSPLWRKRSLGCRLNVLEIPLDDLKRAARTAGGTLNDVFIAAVTGGLALYHSDHDERVESLRMSMPINLRSGEKARQAGNQFVPARIIVPLGILDARARVRIVREIVQKYRHEPALPLMDEIAAAINLLGDAASTRMTGAMMKAVDFVTSNVPGPPFPVYTSGARIERMYPFGPLAGAAVNITLFSYDGVAHVGINADSMAIPDSDRLCTRLADGFGQMLQLT